MDNILITIEDWNHKDKEVPLFQLIQWKYALSLEIKGLKHSKGSVFIHVCDWFNVPKDHRDGQIVNVYDLICAWIDDVKDQLRDIEGKPAKKVVH